MNRAFRNYLVLATIAFPAPPRLLFATDETPTKPTIQFRDFPGTPEDDVKYKFSLIVEVEGSNEKFESKDNTATGGFGGPALADFFQAQIKKASGWKFSVTKSKLIIEGWTDPKTGTFHPVKKIRFESPNLPKESHPVVTIPTTKG